MIFRRAPRYSLLVGVYSVIANVSYLGALWLRFDGQVPAHWRSAYLALAPAYTLLTLVSYYLAGLFHSLWRFASTATLFQILRGAILSMLVLALTLRFSGESPFPVSLIVTVPLLQIVLLGAARLMWLMARQRAFEPAPRRAAVALIVGAGSRGVDLAHEMERSRGAGEPLAPVGFIDDDPWLTGRLIEGIKVLGTVADLPRILTETRAERVIVSDPGIPARVVREIAHSCEAANVRVKTLPGLADLNPERPHLAQVRDMRIDDLLGREPVQLDLGEVGEYLRGERVLVTGAGGSIGSELARQVAEFDVSELVLLDHAENGLYYLHNELSTQRPGLTVHAVVADIQDPEGLDVAFQRFRPTLVLHAAAHKHVPLLEANPREAVLNNIVGTRHLVQLSDRMGVPKFVLISTDKAVNPTSVMGVSKRVCEMLLQSRSRSSATRFVAVRFGNVLGSDGSVVPLFQRQLERGGPLTVTHPDARRYFMTIPEAVRLVLQAGAMGKGGDVYLLEMGEQVRIIDLARQVIRLAGLREGEDIEIIFTGLRPGEKLHEELHSAGEQARVTRHERILKWELDICDEDELLRQVAELERLARAGDGTAIREALSRLVPEFGAAAVSVAPTARLESPPVVELPVTATMPGTTGTSGAPRSSSRATPRGILAPLAALGLVLSAPLWALLWLEARGRGAGLLTYEVRVGRTRRERRRRMLPSSPQVDRRTHDRRGQDLPGRPLRCARFRSDLGPVSRWARRHGLDRLPYLVNVMRGEMGFDVDWSDDDPRPRADRGTASIRGVTR